MGIQVKISTLLSTVCLGSLLCAGQLSAQEVFPFPGPASASVTGKTLKDSKHQWRKSESHLPKDAPNIVIFMTDDVGKDLGSPVAMDYLDRAPFEFSGKIEKIHISYVD